MTAYDSVVLADEPVVYWPCDETSGSVLADLATGFNPGTALDPYTRNTAPLTTDGSPSLTLDSGGSLHLPVGGLGARGQPTSVEVWFYLTSWTNSLTIWGGSVSDSNQAGFGLVLNWGGAANKVLGFWGDAGFAALWTLSQSLAPDTLYHLVWTGAANSPGNLTCIYVNGVQVLSQAVSYGTRVAADEYMGVPKFTGFGATPAVGRFAKVALYGTVLSPAQVLAHYTAGTAVVVAPVDMDPDTAIAAAAATAPSADSTLTAPVATATAAAPAPTVASPVQIWPSAASATAAGWAPKGTEGDAVPWASASATARAPSTSTRAAVPAATASAAAAPPTVTSVALPVTVNVATATAVATATSPIPTFLVFSHLATSGVLERGTDGHVDHTQSGELALARTGAIT